MDFFNAIDHDHLLAMLGDFPARRMVLGWLKAGVVETGVGLAPTTEGVPQGGVISPLILNIALHGLEEAAGVRYQSGASADKVTPASPAVTRYADDLVACCHTRQQAEQVKAKLAEWLAPRGLAFNEAKTRIVHLTEGFDFLAFNLRRYRNGKLLITPSKAAVKEFRKRLAREFHALRGANVAAVLARIVPITRGWVAYYRTVVSSRVFDALGNYLWKLTYKWACWSHSNKPKRWIVQRYYGKFNKFRGDRWVFGDRATGAYLPKLDRDRAAHPGQGRGVPRRPRPDPVLGATPTQGQTPTGLRHRAPAVQAGRAVPPVRGRPADLRGPTPDPPRLGMVVPLGNQKGDHGGLPRLPRRARHVTRSTNTPRTCPLLPEEEPCPGRGEHRVVEADVPNRPRGLLGPCACDNQR